MRVLFIGDIVGTPGVELVRRRLPDLRKTHSLDFVIANAENAEPGGIGLSSEALAVLLEAGVDVLTGGNHSWQSDSAVALAHPQVLRPLNVPDTSPGRGWLTLESDAGVLTVVNLGDEDAILGTPGAPDRVTAPLDAFNAVPRRGVTVVDVHAEHVFTKQAIAHALDGEVAAVLGTHTHEPTMPIHVLPRGTILVTDVGMTGCVGGVMGFAPGAFVAGLRRGVVLDGPTPKPVDGTAALGAVLIVVDQNRVSAERLT